LAAKDNGRHPSALGDDLIQGKAAPAGAAFFFAVAAQGFLPRKRPLHDGQTVSPQFLVVLRSRKQHLRQTLSGETVPITGYSKATPLYFRSLVQRFLKPPIPALKLRLAISRLTLHELGLRLGRLVVTSYVIDLGFTGSLAQRKPDETQHQ
jgi:hypothetical protein